MTYIALERQMWGEPGCQAAILDSICSVRAMPTLTATWKTFRDELRSCESDWQQGTLQGRLMTHFLWAGAGKPGLPPLLLWQALSWSRVEASNESSSRKFSRQFSFWLLSSKEKRVQQSASCFDKDTISIKKHTPGKSRAFMKNIWEFKGPL